MLKNPRLLYEKAMKDRLGEIELAIYSEMKEGKKYIRLSLSLVSDEILERLRKAGYSVEEDYSTVTVSWENKV